LKPISKEKNMSRSVITRIVFSVLIAIVLVAGIFTSVQGARLSSGVKGGQAHVNLSLHPIQSSSSSSSNVESFGLQSGDMRGGPGHDCDSEAYNPLDD